MAQTLLIGLGGTGSRVINNVVKELHANKKEINDGNICCAVLDTNVNDNESITNSGTGVPVISTSRAMKIREYLDTYQYLHMEEWCPQSPAFREQSMIDGASEMRLKSRIAFLDSCETKVIEGLELSINELLKNGAGSKIRIMIVSSLSGGTGSGMFIQVALWLRKFFEQSEITIRGIFLLPDVFVHTLGDIKANKATKTQHYCNAYAAIQELNAITKIKIGGDITLPEKISLDNLFDSEKNKDDGTPVYDFAFFVDYKDENDIALNKISDYEKMVAQLVYMQLYAPMKDDMYSEEDNTFLEFTKAEEPLYGSCGTAKAVYPRNSVKTYCSLRAAQDSLTGGWRKIDAEIDAQLEEKKQAEKDGIFSNETIDPRAKYVELFEEKTSVRPEDAGKDRFFITIAKDVKNQSKSRGEGGKIIVTETDKVDDFIKDLDGKKIDTIVTKYSGTAQFSLDADQFVAADHDKDALMEQIRSDEVGLAEALHSFEKKADGYADTIVNSVFPYSMGDVNPSNICSIYGLLSKQDDMGNWNFVHPVAARYILYKLVQKLNKAVKNATLADSKQEAMAGGSDGNLFDNKSTAETETTAVEFLDSKKWYQKESAFFDEFEKRYAQFIATKIGLCEKYEKELLKVSVYKKLAERVTGLIGQLEAFFRKLDDVQEKLQDSVDKNAKETSGIVGKTMYVFGDGESKEFVYRSLDMKLDQSSHEVNKSLIEAIYGRVCAEKRESIPENQKYKDISVVSAFIAGLVYSFRQRIDGDRNNSEQVNLDIYAAICKESDARLEKQAEEQRKRDREEGKIEDPLADFDKVDFETGKVAKDTSKAQRHTKAFEKFKKKLYDLAAPFLIHTKEVSKNVMGTVTSRDKTFWGFSDDVAKAYPFFGTVLGVNEDLQADSAYPKNELYCYRATYGIAAQYIPKFNELAGGDYYTSYNMLVGEMVADFEGRRGERALVNTPHLDKNWHRILPAITEEKQKQVELAFYRGLWLAIAYGMLKTDKDGNIILRRPVDTGYGDFMDADIPLMYKGKNLTKTDVVKIIEILKTDRMFKDVNVPALEQRFANEREDMDNYVDTKVMKGLMTGKDDLNPIDFVSRYNGSLKHNRFVSKRLIEALEGIAYDLAAAFNTDRSEKKLEEAKYRLCKMIYDSSTRSKGKSEVFEDWEKAFEQHKLKG
ncbi:MAG: hypothetical protein E7605_02850 [Ruminococcaceae bacterium]|nr:hypothetical protein [Oscillospiraceae bacterium]